MRRIDELEGLRGILAWWVVVGHVLYSVSGEWGRLSYNRSAVDVFIIMSGLVIMFLLDDRREATGPFLIRRFFRLWPAYLAVLVASALSLGMTIEAIEGAPAGGRNAERLVYATAALSDLPAHFAAHLAMLHGLVPTGALPHADHTLISPAWSISVEWQFYLLAPLIYAGLTSGWVGRIGVLVLALGLYGASYLPAIRDNNAFVGAYVPWFAIGIGSYFLWRKQARVGLLLLAAGCAAAGVALREPGAIVWAAILLLLAEVPGTAWVRAVLKTTPLRSLGQWSYSTYIVHMLPLYAAMWLANGWLEGWAYAAFIGLVTVLGTLALSWAMFRWVEKPGMALGAALARPRVVATA